MCNTIFRDSRVKLYAISDMRYHQLDGTSQFSPSLFFVVVQHTKYTYSHYKERKKWMLLVLTTNKQARKTTRALIKFLSERVRKKKS